MKKWYLLFFLLVMAMAGCDNGSSSGGSDRLNMDGDWTGQWGANVESGGGGAFPDGGTLKASLKLNGRQLTGTVMADGVQGNFSATLSNPNGSGNIEAGLTIINSQLLGVVSISFHGTYSSNQIYAQFGPSVQLGNQGLSGNLTMTR